jgi:hypothetical protein
VTVLCDLRHSGDVNGVSRNTQRRNSGPSPRNGDAHHDLWRITSTVLAVATLAQRRITQVRFSVSKVSDVVSYR